MLAAPLVALAAALPSKSTAASPILRVGPGRRLRTLAEAARWADDGATIEVDAGTYRADVAVWSQRDLTLRAVGGRVRLIADGVAAQGKAIWVVWSPNMSVDGFDFEGAAVEGRNGAGIRFERGRLALRNCSFTRNEMGLLTSNEESCVLDIAACEFAHNQRPDGHNHNLYVGTIAKLSVRASYFHHARTGHLLKSRAAQNEIVCNRLTDESGGSASYELEFPNGGVAVVIGNLIEQGVATANPHLISFGAEGYPWPRNALYLAHNTLVDRLTSGGVFVRVAPGATGARRTVRAVNNLLLGPSQLEEAGAGDYRGNVHAALSDFADPTRGDYRLRADSPAVGLAVASSAVMGDTAGGAPGPSLALADEYVHPMRLRPLGNARRLPGAAQTTVSPSHRRAGR